MKIRRRTVFCWHCGHRARRVPSLRGLFLDADEAGRVGVVGRKRRVLAYGICGAAGRYDPCSQVMLRPADARFVLRAAIEWDRRGHNRTSEFDA